jgi:hypothetical protein
MLYKLLLQRDLKIKALLVTIEFEVLKIEEFFVC